MNAQQKISRVRRDYNRWVANETLEDYALRFTAKKARRWSMFRVANAAIGGISFLALEAIGGAITLTYGFNNAVAAIAVVGVLIFLTGLPISYFAAKHGVDIDLLTRRGFGYLGSTITSLIYASFTFIFFALEAAIMAKALNLSIGLPEVWGYLVSSLVVLPLVVYGFTFISRFQLWTQPFWIVLQVLPFIYIAIIDDGAATAWMGHTGTLGHVDGRFDLLLFGAASGVLFSLVAQIGEQVDYLRFLPRRRRGQRLGWWIALISTGPGWIVLGSIKLLAGSFLAYLAFRDGVPPVDATEPTHMYAIAFNYVFSNPSVALGTAAFFVIVSQLKINVTNSYAGSIAWSNFFSRLTHSHPGRVVWLVFNIAISLMLMEFGVYKSLQHILGLYSHVAVAWVGAIVADLVINKPLGLSPRSIEFKRAHLFDINPVGFGAMLLASIVSICAYLGMFGETAAALSCYIGLAIALVSAPAIAWATGGRFYIAREPMERRSLATEIRCCVCEHEFENEDMTHCPAYAGPICSLCCTLDARCHDVCKVGSRFSEQIIGALSTFLPSRLLARFNSSLGHYLALLIVVVMTFAAVLAVAYWQAVFDGGGAPGLAPAMLKAFFGLVLIAGVVCWLIVLAHESRVVAQEETRRQTSLLLQEIEAHERTDHELQKAKEVAEAANLAKSRYLAGISHEFRTPLNTILGYAQLIEAESLSAIKRENAVRTIRRSGEHLAGLVDGLLDIAKIEAGRLELERNVFEATAFLEQIVDMFRLQAESKGIGFVFEAPDTLPKWVRSDEKRLRQILINLLSNAIKFTSRGEVRFAVRSRGDIVEFIVEDTGVGIAQQDLERIFVPFERIETAGETWAPGTGLGLTITKLMSEVMGGNITVESQPGAGSRFCVRLYLPSAVGPPGHEERARTIVGYEGPRLTVLVADDEESHRQLVADILTPLGFSVIQAADGAECLRLARETDPGLVLLDITMPGLNGWDIARELRETQMSACAIIMVSADMPKPQEAGNYFGYHDDYIGKPFAVDAFLEQIRTALEIDWVRRGAGSPRSMAAPRASESLPSREDLLDLKSLVEIGYVRGITEKLADIARSDADAHAFAARLSPMVAGVDLDALLKTLEVALDERESATAS